jgi:hypothetical protein
LLVVDGLLDYFVLFFVGPVSHFSLPQHDALLLELHLLLQLLRVCCNVLWQG